jgi:hypothetical protein
MQKARNVSGENYKNKKDPKINLSFLESNLKVHHRESDYDSNTYKRRNGDSVSFGYKKA